MHKVELRDQEAKLDRIDFGALDALNRVARKWLELDGEALTKGSIKKRRAKIERRPSMRSSLRIRNSTTL